MSEYKWPSEWLRGVLTLAVMRVLADGPTYGYAIIASLEEQGFGKLKGGTLYPLLGRLEQAGHVAVDWRAGDGGPGRKYFALTAEGERELETSSRLWSMFATQATAFIMRDSERTPSPWRSEGVVGQDPNRGSKEAT